jgi:hypothetical protein
MDFMQKSGKLKQNKKDKSKKIKKGFYFGWIYWIFFRISPGPDDEYANESSRFVSLSQFELSLLLLFSYADFVL